MILGWTNGDFPTSEVMSLLVIDIVCMADGKLATVFFYSYIFGGEAE